MSFKAKYNPERWSIVEKRAPVDGDYYIFKDNVLIADPGKMSVVHRTPRAIVRPRTSEKVVVSV